MPDLGGSFVPKLKLHEPPPVEPELASEIDDYIRGTISCQAKMADQIRQLEYALDDALRQRDELGRLLIEAQRRLSPPVQDELPSLLPTEVPPLIAQAQEAFHRDLPSLLIDHRGEWVAYHGDQAVGFSHSMLDLYQECSRREIKLNEFLVRRVDPDLLEEPVGFDVTPDV